MEINHNSLEKNINFIVVDQYRKHIDFYGYFERVFYVHDKTIGVWKIKRK